MAKKRSKIVDYLVYLVVRVFICIIQALPFSVACRLADGLAWLAYRVDRRHRLVADDNLQHAFPGRYNDAQRDQLVRSVYQHFCTLLMEILFLARLVHVTNWRTYVDLTRGGPHLANAMLTNRPLLMVTGHFGNWEMASFVLGMLGVRLHAVARPLDNDYLDRFLRRYRERTGQRMLAKKGDFDRMAAILARGAILGTLGDQDAGQRGLFVEFFNRPASTHKAVALLALEYNVPMLVSGLYRVGHPMRYTMVVEDLILPEEYADNPDRVRLMTQRFTTALERMIRLAPEQYFWLHRRWKHQPKERKKVA